MHTFKVVSADVSTIQLDIENVVVHAVLDADSGKALRFRVDEWPWITDESNQVLTIYLVQEYKLDSLLRIKIEYHTKPEGLGLNWLNENQTDTHQPFFYTDCQSYYCRSVAPLQDTPAIKAPFTAKIRVPRPLIALSSGVPVGQRIVDDMVEFEFNQTNPVPSYLIAILAGVLERRQIDHRTYVYAEPSMINTSAEVLSDIGEFMNIVYNIPLIRRLKVTLFRISGNITASW